MVKIKNPRQIARIKESCDILSLLLKELAPMAREGVTTWELDAFARDYIAKAGGKPAFLGYMGYPAALCVSIDEEVIHGIPSKARRLKRGDIVSLDCGIDLGGYFSDAAISVAVGRADFEAERLLKATKECLDAAVAQAAKGNRIHHIGKAVSAIAGEHGYGVVHQFCGHGVGFSQHEDPQVPNYVSPGPNPRIVPGMVLAIEPMITLGTGDVRILQDGWTVVTLDSSRAAHFEHTVAVTESGPVALTSWDL